MKLFKRITAVQVHAQQLEDARVHALEARCAAEYWAAVADMYEKRVDRLYGHASHAPKSELVAVKMGGKA